jgi:diketogulonate reductase-like aldo/keto reductase
MQKGILPVIKSENERRLKENLDAMNGLFDDSQCGVKLSNEDILTIDGLNKNQNIFMGLYDML